jgi:diguanylate cyclase (GGDEF)-like protein
MGIRGFVAKLKGGFPPDDPRRTLLLARQLQHYYALVPMAVAGNMFNGLVISVYAQSSASNYVILCWLFLIVAMSGLRLQRRSKFELHACESRLNKLQRENMALAAVMGLTWAAAICYLLALPGGRIAVPAMVGAGMMSAAASTLNVVPGAALAFIAPIAFGAAVGFGMLDSAEGYAAMALLISYCVVLARSVASYFSQFVKRVAHEFNLVEHTGEIEHIANHDTLTGLPNRLPFQKRLEHELLRLGASGGRLTVLNVDLDRFKEVNDTLGHSIGDLLLRAVANDLRQCAPSSDSIARFGGDEFCILLNSSHGETEADAVAQRTIATLKRPYSIEGHVIVIGASVGMASAPKNGVTMERLLKCADLAMYGAKALGSGKALWFAPEMEEALLSKRRLEIELREALLENQFVVFYQPIVDMRDGRTAAYEALLRWRHPQRGMVSPAEFISVAEETGQIVALGEWVLRQACCDALNWPGHIGLAVNLAPKQFQQSNVAEVVRQALAKSGLAPERLELEITETTLMTDTQDIVGKIDELNRMGVGITLDDFGTGYSSLSYLNRFPVKKLKIDRSFIKNMLDSPKAQAIVSSVSLLARELGIDVVAEGIETHEQLACVATKNIFLIQGFLFCRPKALDELLEHGHLVGDAELAPHAA